MSWGSVGGEQSHLVSQQLPPPHSGPSHMHLGRVPCRHVCSQVAQSHEAPYVVTDLCKQAVPSTGPATLPHEPITAGPSWDWRGALREGD